MKPTQSTSLRPKFANTKLPYSHKDVEWMERSQNGIEFVIGAIPKHLSME